MKHVFLAIVAVVVLAACGGGSGGSTSIPHLSPTISPTTAPQTAYHLTWIGGLTGARGANAYERLVKGSRSTQDVGVANPVLLVAPPIAADAGADDSGATVQVQASPAPSSAPVTFSLSSSTDVSAVPTSATPPPGVIAQQQIDANSPHVDASATETATIAGTPATIPVIVYNSFTMGCNFLGGLGISGEAPGVTLDANGNATENDTIANDDLYITGGNCPGAFNDPTLGVNDPETLHIPGASSVPIPSGGFSAIASSVTGTSQETFMQADLDSTNAIIFTTHGGSLCKIFAFGAGLVGGNQSDLAIAIACHGTSSDGF